MEKVITISREYGSGGHELGVKLADKLGIPFYDKELIGMISKEGNIEESILRANDEVVPDLDNYSMREIQPYYQIAMTEHIYKVQCDVIQALADKGACVIVGRCADAILNDSVNIFVYGDIESRVKRIREREPELSPENARLQIRAMDKKRKAYHQYYSSKEWGVMTDYHLCLNSGPAGVDGCLDAAFAYLNHVK
ncbi:MAG: cytidylate kinase-like family protein [Clostridiaceae bacterium]|nr:cytidylate kinase-like family protein [Clostridiaceae bacterium]